MEILKSIAGFIGVMISEELAFSLIAGFLLFDIGLFFMIARFVKIKKLKK